jgi:hypothetical protein
VKQIDSGDPAKAYDRANKQYIVGGRGRNKSEFIVATAYTLSDMSSFRKKI